MKYLKRATHLSIYPSTLAALLGASEAKGIISYFDSSHSFSIGYNGSSFVQGSAGWNIDQDDSETNEALLSAFYVDVTAFAQAGVIQLVPSANQFSWAGFETSTILFSDRTYLKAYTTGQSIGPANGFFDHRLNVIFSSLIDLVSGFDSGVPAYMGYRFQLDGTTVYGWAQIVITANGDIGKSSVEIVEWAYENDGSAIRVGAIPEPAAVATGLGALALGAAGVRSWRKRKKQ